MRTPALALPPVMLTVAGTLAYEFPVTLPVVARGRTARRAPERASAG